jgi:type IV pilus assembly protein PilY1
MKLVFQPFVSALALASLLAGAASHATNLAELPLKISVLAKPNVIFGMDDSGSMDWEVLLDTTNGTMWWNGSSAWDSTAGKPVFSNSSFIEYGFLFPVGTATGGQVQTYNGIYGRALPPTS